MTASTQQNRYAINGVIDTAKPVMANLENIANSASSWLTYDMTDGKWSVVINQAGTSSFTFNEDNIVGGIDVSGLGLDRLYNAVEVQFPNKDLDDSNDFVRLDLTSGDRKSNEPDNLLKLNYPLINDSIQAELIGLLELKQSRMNLTAEWTGDFSTVGVTAGDIVTVNNSAHGWTNKLFRILQTEEKLQDAAINVKFTAIEYDATVYDADLTRVTRSNADGVITIGEIGQMSQPTVTRIGGAATPNSDESRFASMPRLLIESTVPSSSAGIIEGIEVWYYDIPDSELPTYATVDDEARTYKLHSVIKPSPNAYFDPSEEVDYYISDLTDANTGFGGNFLIKLRAINSTTKGPYSAVSGLVEYTPKQRTDVIDDNVEVDEGSGNILTTFGLAGLMSLLNSLMRDGSSGSGSLFEKIFDIFQGDTGVDLLDPTKKVINCAESYSYVNGYLLHTTKNDPDDGCIRTELIPANPTASEEIL
jgi:hypothetical protein